jgi:hypothetical protein
MREPKTVYFLSGFFLAVIGAFALWASGPSFIQAVESSRWASVNGEIVSSDIVRVPNPGQRGITTGAEIQYTYSVADQVHTGTRLRFMDYASSDDSASQARLDFPQGATVSVYYDPEQPDVSVLRPGLHWFAVLLPLMSTTFLVVGLFLIRRAVRGAAPVSATEA